MFLPADRSRSEVMTSLVLGVALLVLLCGMVARADDDSPMVIEFTTIALSGQAAPGTDATFVGFDLPILNESGQAAFAAALSSDDDGSLGTWGIWGPTRREPLGLVALEGKLAPGAGDTERFSTFGGLRLGEAGRLGFVASLTDDSGPIDSGENTGLWAQLDGLLPVLVAREGSPAPGTSIGLFGFLGPPLLNAVGGVAFRGSLDLPRGGVPQDGALWATATAGLQLLAREGDDAVGQPGGVEFDDPFTPLSVTDRGETYFLVGLNADGRRIAVDRGLYRSNFDGELALLLRTGEASPGLDEGEVFVGFENTRFNERGDFAMVGVTRSESGARATGVFAASAGEPPVPLVRSGETPPGAPPGALFESFSDVEIDALGRVAFAGRHRTEGIGPPVDGIWGPDGAGGVALYLQEGDPAPGFDEGVFVRGIGSLMMNDAGNVAFGVGLEGSGIDSSNDVVLYLALDPCQVMPVTREGSVLEVLDGDLRTIDRLDVIARSEFGSSALGPSGHVAFRARFTDASSGIFVAIVGEGPILVEIDAQPGRPFRLRNPRSRRWIPVAILGSSIFDVADVDVRSLAFGPDGASPAHPRDARYVDVNRDGLVDLVSRFRLREAGIGQADEKVCLVGITFAGASFEGCDTIEPPKRRRFPRGR